MCLQEIMYTAYLPIYRCTTHPIVYFNTEYFTEQKQMY